MKIVNMKVDPSTTNPLKSEFPSHHAPQNKYNLKKKNGTPM